MNNFISSAFIAVYRATINMIDLACNLCHAIIQRPLLYVYRYGPARLGFWNGASDAYICQQLTHGVEHHHWIQHPTECAKLIAHNFEAFVCFTLVVITVIVIAHWYLMLMKGLMFYFQCRILQYLRRENQLSRPGIH